MLTKPTEETKPVEREAFEQAQEWMQQTGEYATELRAAVGADTYQSILETLSQFGQASAAAALERAAGLVAASSYTPHTWQQLRDAILALKGSR